MVINCTKGFPFVRDETLTNIWDKKVSRYNTATVIGRKVGASQAGNERINIMDAATKAITKTVSVMKYLNGNFTYQKT